MPARVPAAQGGGGRRPAGSVYPPFNHPDPFGK